MQKHVFPVIDPVATGHNIVRLRKERGLKVRDLQEYFGFEEPQAIYKWQRGESLPCVDNLYALGVILHVTVDEILVPMAASSISVYEQQASACCSAFFSKAVGKIKRQADACAAVFLRREMNLSVLQ